MNVIECNGVVKRYGSTRALDGLDLHIKAGGPVALVGANGAGKTTLLSVVCGFLRPAAGQVRVFGEAPGSAAVRGRLAAMPQDAQLHPHRSIARQLEHFARLQGANRYVSRREAARVLEQVQLPDVGNKRPGALSHGMRKRVALAQALLGTPELVLLDEPTAGIDPPNVKIIRDIIRSLAEQVTFVISSHNLDELEKLASIVVSLEHGRCVAQGPISLASADEFLSLHAPTIPEPDFLQRAAQLTGVLSIEHRGQGEYRIRCAPTSRVDQQLLALLAEQGWHYRSLTRGQSLEERLYGQ